MIRKEEFIMIIGYIFCIVIAIISIAYVVIIERENKKLKRNPIPKMKNSDKRFHEIEKFYSHKVFEITRGK